MMLIAIREELKAMYGTFGAHGGKFLYVCRTRGPATERFFDPGDPGDVFELPAAGGDL